MASRAGAVRTPRGRGGRTPARAPRERRSVGGDDRDVHTWVEELVENVRLAEEASASWASGAKASMRAQVKAPVPSEAAEVIPMLKRVLAPAKMKASAGALAASGALARQVWIDLQVETDGVRVPFAREVLPARWLSH